MWRRLRSARSPEFWAAVLLCVGLMVIVSAEFAGADTNGLRARSGSLVNQSRHDEDVPGLERHSALDHVAAVHAQRMADAGAIFHNGRLAQEVEAQGVDWKRLGENVGMGPSVEVIHDGFMASEVHRHNVLEPQFHAFGVGVVLGHQSDGRERLYVVHVFGDLVTESEKQKSTIARDVTPVLRSQAPPAPARAAAPLEVAPTAVRTPVRRPVVPAAATSPDPNALTGGVVVPL